MMNRNINIVFFSSGISEKSETMNAVINGLKNKDYNCYSWRDLFQTANDPRNIALLPMLIKKIPTFDFAVLICEGHDTTTMIRNGEKFSVPSMRDNVLFEIGLCAMALGLSKIILLTDGAVHMPEDLVGVNGKLAIKNIIMNDSCIHSDPSHDSKWNDFQTIINEIDEYINGNADMVSPVVIGAAISTAIGYVNNFIFNLLENIEDGFTSTANEENIPHERYAYDREHIFLHICVPAHYTQDTPACAERMRKKLNYGTLQSARNRKIAFNYKIQNNDLHIYDYPSTLVTSYSTAKMILDMKADDERDQHAEDRFNDKELDLFVATLYTILQRDYVVNTVGLYYPGLSQYEKSELTEKICYYFKDHITIDQINYEN